MRTTGRLWLGIALGLAMAALGWTAAAAERPVGVVCNIKVVSDKVDDVSSLEDWKRSCIKDSMSNDEKALAIWKTVVKYRHQTAPPNEFLQQEGNVHDVMKTIHVYGYGMCCCASANTEQLARYIGWDARGWAITLHSVPEVYYDNAWHLLDGSLMNYFRNPDKSIASVADLQKAVGEWHAANPGYRGDDAKLRKFAAKGNWRKAGPALLATSESYSEDGPNAAGWHGWSSTMIEYDRADRHHPYEYGYSQGYQLNLALRPGERLTRNWFNKGLHINMDGSGEGPGNILNDRNGLSLQRKLGDIAPGRIGNGTLEYEAPLSDPAFLAAALAADNLGAASKAPALGAKDPAKPGVLILRMPSSYVYLGGEAIFQAIIGPGGSITVGLSDNNGLDWKELEKVTATGLKKLDLKPHIFRRYDYRLKFELQGEGTGLDSLKLTHDIQHSQCPLPALAEGENKITFAAGPQEGTITIEGATNPDVKPKQLIAADFHPEFKGADHRQFRVKEYDEKGGSITFPVETPGDLVRLRGGAHYRARDKREGWMLQASFDDGKTWAEIGKLPGPTPGNTKYFTLESVPKGVRKALVRFQSTRQYNTLCIFDFRIDADYAAPAAGFRPVKITYVWTEGGAEKRDVHVAKSPKDTYTIQCAAAPIMKSIVLELAE
ncbi:MAG TPA: hypothetical protein P5532_22140 [Planctomycetota bacterium]|nr:hypothetical protein [Planctomycetota bacterium]